MKMRLDLLEYLTPEDILEGAIESVHRYDPKPRFSKTGVGSLHPATAEERAQEEARLEALVDKLKQRKYEAEKRKTKSGTKL